MPLPQTRAAPIIRPLQARSTDRSGRRAECDVAASYPQQSAIAAVCHSLRGGSDVQEAARWRCGKATAACPRRTDIRARRNNRRGFPPPQRREPTVVAPPGLLYFAGTDGWRVPEVYRRTAWFHAGEIAPKAEEHFTIRHRQNPWIVPCD